MNDERQTGGGPRSEPWGAAAGPRPAPPWPQAPGAVPPPAVPTMAAVSAPLAGAAQPAPTWNWKGSLLGLGLAIAPEAALTLLALPMNDTTSTAEKVTAGAALTLVIASLALYGWHIFAAWLFSLHVTAGGLRAWGFRRPTAAFFWTIPVGLLATYTVSYMYGLLVDSKQQDIVDAFPHSTAGVVLFIVLAVIMAPLFEETFFRGFLYRGFANSWGWKWGAVASAALFAAAHLQLDIFVPLFTLGLALAWVYKRTGSVWTGIVFHALFNGLAVLAWALS